MKKLFLIILLLTVSLPAQVTRYVNKNAVGGVYDGLSWATGWKTFADINWGALTPGSTLYISGGADSAIYYGSAGQYNLVVGASGSLGGGRIKIWAGKYSPSPSGHSGRVILDGGSESIRIDNQNRVWIKGLECRNAEASAVHMDNTANFIILDSLRIYDYNQSGADPGAGLLLKCHGDSTVVQYCYVQDLVDGDGQSDCVHINGADTYWMFNTIMHDNVFRCTSQDPYAHNDAFQSVAGDGFILWNNIVINDSVNSPEGGGMPFILSAVNKGRGLPTILFNNFCYMGGAWYPGASPGWIWEIRHDDGGSTWSGYNGVCPTYAFNNTFVANGPRMRCVGNNSEAYGNLIANNIIAMYCLPDDPPDYWRTGSTHGWFSAMEWGASYGHDFITDSVRNNLIWREDSTNAGAGDGQDPIITGEFDTGELNYASDWDDWIAIGGTGLFRDPKFVIPFGHWGNQGTVIPDIKSSSPAIDAGEDMTASINYLLSTYTIPADAEDAMFKDFYGNPRGNGSGWDIGAVEYGAATVDSVPSFSFTALTNRELNTEYIATSPITGIDTVSHFLTTTSALFKINYNGIYSTVMKTADPDNGADTLYVKNTTGGSYSTMYTETIVGGGNSQNFNVTTKAAPGGGVNGGWASGSNGRKIYDKNGKAIILRTQ